MISETWMYLEIVILSKVNHKEKGKDFMIGILIVGALCAVLAFPTGEKDTINVAEEITKEEEFLCTNGQSQERWKVAVIVQLAISCCWVGMLMFVLAMVLTKLWLVATAAGIAACGMLVFTRIRKMKRALKLINENSRRMM